MRALVLWADDRSTNLGVRALASGTAALITRTWPEAEVDVQGFGPGVAPVPINTRNLAAAFLGARRDLADWLSGYDLVVDTRAGDSFADIYGLKRLALMTALSAVAARSGPTVVMGPQTIGPFTTAAGRRIAGYALARADLVMARDSTSAEYAAGLGRPVDVLTTDVVFALKAPAVNKTRDVILNVSGLLWQPSPHVDSERYRDTVLTLHRRLVAQGRHVSLLAHVIDSGNPDNDVPAMREFAQMLDADIEMIEPHSLGEVREIVASAELVVASRMHACLNALSVGTPAVPLAYSRKFEPLLRDLGWAHTVDLRSAADPVGDALELVESADLSGGTTRVAARAADLIQQASDALATRTARSMH